MSTHLGYAVFISESIPQKANRPLPNGDRPVWSPLSTTLIYGENDAVLVDPPFTREQARAVGEWLQASDKNVTHIFATHGHGDHWFTAGLLAERWTRNGDEFGLAIDQGLWIVVQPCERSVHGA